MEESFYTKTGTEGVANPGNESYLEYYASQIAEAMGIKSISYGLAMWQKRICSICELFTSKKFAFMSAENIIKTGGIPVWNDKKIGFLIC